MKNATLIISILICQLSFGQDKDITKDFNYKNFENYYNQAIEFSNKGDLKNAAKRADYALKAADKLEKKGFGDVIKSKVSELKSIQSQKPRVATAKEERDARNVKNKGRFADRRAVKEKVIAEQKERKDTRAKEAEARRNAKISKLPPAEPYNSKLASQFKALAKSKLSGYTTVKVIFRNNGWNRERGAYNRIVSRAIMTAFVLKDSNGDCFLWYLHFEQKANGNSGTSFGSTYISNYSERNPKPLECSALN